MLDPCRHVVCDRCFDGASYSACPVCEHHVDRSSPFFREPPQRGAGVERVVFDLIDLGDDLEDAARASFTGLCARTQALSPADRAALVAIVDEYGAKALTWLPPEIPVRENVAAIFGTLCKRIDPCTVELKFALQGEHGVFLPLVLDLREGTLDWLDAYAKGQFEMNNVETSNGAISKMCPALIAYFRSGVRASMLDLALLHAAARCRRVFVRGASTDCFERGAAETAQAFHARLARGAADRAGVRLQPGEEGGVLALLYRGDVDLAEGSSAYALFRERVAPTLSAGDLIV